MWVWRDDVFPEAALGKVPQIVNILGGNTGVIEEDQGTILQGKREQNHIIHHCQLRKHCV
jgi:hypothetical protein